MKITKKAKLISLCSIVILVTVIMILLQEDIIKSNTEVANEELEDYTYNGEKNEIKIYTDEKQYDLHETNKDEKTDLKEDTSKYEYTIDINNIETIINGYLADIYEQIGLVLYDINTGQSIKINENEEFMGASTYKVLMNIVAYEDIKSEYGSLEDILYYSDVYYEEGTGILQYEYFDSLDLQTLLDYSIIYSDNIATNMVTGYLGGMSNMLYTAGEILDENICVSDNIITPNQMFSALKFIYQHKDEEYYSHLIDIMTKTVFNDRLDKELPSEIVAHKIGSYGMYIHDAGIVLLKDNPYIIVIYTYGLENPNDIISDISNIIYKQYLGIDDKLVFGHASIY